MKWVEAIEADILQTEVSPAQPASKTQSGQTPLTSGFSVLVVDDDVAILATISEILSFEGYPVQTATNGLEGLAAIDSYLPSLVLLDMRMPVLDGWGFAHAVRDRGYPIPIVVMTAAQDAQLWANEIGAAAVLPKPFNLDDLIEVVERFKTSES